MLHSVQFNGCDLDAPGRLGSELNKSCLSVRPLLFLGLLAEPAEDELNVQTSHLVRQAGRQAGRQGDVTGKHRRILSAFGLPG